jgi:hypothetical protein
MRATTTTVPRRREEEEATAAAKEEGVLVRASARGGELSMGRPSVEAAAMAGADWARYHCVDEEEEEPPEHLRAFEAFLETVVPPDMVLAFGREEAARGERLRRCRREDVQEKLKLWAKAVAREARHCGALGSQHRQAAASPRLTAHAREPVILARPPGEPAASSLARGGREEGGAQTLPGQARVVGELGIHPNALLAPSPSSGRRGEPCQSNQPLPKQDIKCIYGV